MSGSGSARRLAGALLAALTLLFTSGCFSYRLPPPPPLSEELIGDRFGMGGVRSCAYNGDGSLVAVASATGRAYLWDATGHVFRAVMQVSDRAVTAVAFVGDQVVTADESGDLRCWDSQGRPVSRLGRKGSALLCLAVSPGGGEVWAGARDGHVLAWDLHASHPTHEIATREGAIRGIALAPDGKTLYVGTSSALVSAWSVAGGPAPLRTSPANAHGGPVNAVAVAPDGSGVFSACEDGEVRELDPASLKVTRTLSKVGGPVTSLAVRFASLPLLAAGGRNHNLVVWNLSESDETKGAQLMEGNRGAIWAVAISPDGKTVSAGGEDRVIVAHVLGEKLAKGQLPEEMGHPAEVTSVTWSPDDRWIASGGEGSHVLLWDPKTQALARILNVQGEDGESAGTIEAIAWSRQGLLATGAEDGGVRVYDAAGRLVAQAPPNRRGHPTDGHSSQVSAVAFSPDGTLVASGSWDHTIRLWKVPPAGARAAALTLQGVLQGHTNGISDLAFTADGRQLISSSWDHTARIWDVRSRQQLQMLTGMEGPVFSAAFEPGHPVAVAGGWQGETWFWSTSDGSRLVNGLSGESAPDSPEGKLLQTDVVFCLSYSPDAKYLAAGSADRTVLFWDAQTRKPIRNFVGFHGGVRGVSWTKDGRRLAIGTDDGDVFVLDSPFPAGGPAPSPSPAASPAP